MRRQIVLSIAFLSLAGLAVIAVIRRKPSEPSHAAPAQAVPQHSPEQISPVAGASVDSLVAEISGFDSWLKAWRSGAAPAIDSGRDLAAARRRALKRLIPLDPEAALAHAVDDETRASLPSEIAGLLESSIDDTGSLEVTVTCGTDWSLVTRRASVGGHDYAAYTFGRRLSAASKDSIAVHGIAVDDVLAVGDRPYRPAAVETRREGTVFVRVGTNLRTFSSMSALERWTDAVLEAESAPGSAAAAYDWTGEGELPPRAAVAASWVQGTKSVLWIRAEFPDDPGSPATDQQINDCMATVNSYFDEVSASRTQFKATIFPGTLPTLSKAAVAALPTNGEASISADVLQKARLYDAANGATGAYNPDKYDRWIVLFKNVPQLSASQNGTTSGWAGRAAVAAKSLWLNGSISASTVSHELGHNQGLNHSHSWKPTSEAPTGPGTFIEYGDSHDVMGDSSSIPAGHFNIVQKTTLGYIEPAQVTTVTANGTYRISRHDHHDASGQLGLRIQTSTKCDLWVEYKRQVPKAALSYADRIANGVLVHWSGASSPTGVSVKSGTYLLDGTPLSTADMKDAPVCVGETFADYASGTLITPVATGGTSPNEWVDVQVAIVDPQRIPSISCTDAAFGKQANVSVTSPFDVVRTQLFVDGQLWNDSSQANTSVSWVPTTIGSHVIAVTVTYADGAKVTNSRSITVAPPDGWEYITPLPQSNTPTALAYAFGQWWATADRGQLIASADGTVWTRKPAPVRALLRDIASDGKQLILTCSSSDALGVSVPTIWQSSDGATWSALTITGISSAQYVKYVDGLWIVFGDNTDVVTSADGKTWSAPMALPGSGPYRFVIHRDGKWVAAGDKASIAVSANLTTWNSTGNLPPALTTAYGLACNSGRWLFAAYDPTTAEPVYHMSQDLQTWTKMTSPDPRVTPSYVTDIEGQFVVATYNYLSTSPDGIAWTRLSLPVSNLVAIAHGDGGAYVAAGTQAKMYTGASLATLKVTDSYARPSFTGAVAMPDGTVLLSNTAYSSTSNSTYSAVVALQNGTLKPTNATSGMYGIAAREGVYVVVGLGGRIYSSTDGLTWTVRTSGTSQKLNAVAASSAGFVAVGDSGAIVTSRDGMTWTLRSSGTTQNLTVVATDGTRFVAVGNAGLALTSEDSATWAGQNTGNTNSFTALAWQSGIGFCALDSTRTALFVSGDGAAWARNTTANYWYSLQSTSYGLALGGIGMLGLTNDARNITTAYAPTNLTRLFGAGQALFGADSTCLVTQRFTPAEMLPPTFVTQPASQTAYVGRSTALSVNVGGTGPFTYQWMRDGVPIAGATGPTLTLPSVGLADAGSYSVLVKCPSGTVTSAGAVVKVEIPTGPGAWLTNLSVRTVMAAGQDPLIVGLSVQGGSKDILVRGIGPGLAPYGVGNFMVNPRVELWPLGAATASASNDDWTPSLAPVFVSSGAFALPQGSADSALVRKIEGGYSIIAPASGPGLVIIEAYDTAYSSSSPRLVNVSARNFVGTGDNILIEGFAINGTGRKKLLVRAVGPKLAAFGIGGVLADPKVEIYDISGAKIAGNDNWDTSLTATFSSVGAFDLTPGSKDAAMIVELSPGNYTVQCSGADGGTGKAMVEIYELP